MDPRLIGLVFAAVGAATLVGAGWMGWRKRAFVRRSATTVGVVIDFVEETAEHEDRDGDTVTATYFYPLVHFQTASGAQVKFQSNVGTSTPGFRKGQQVPVLYDPARPEEASIRSFVQLWWMPLALAFCGAAMAIVGAVLMLK